MQKTLKADAIVLITVLFLVVTNLMTGCSGRQPGIKNKLEYRKGMVVSAKEQASKVGLSILKKGGNAVDAAVAVQFALAVVYPNAGNLGGGGFMVYRASNGETNTLDFREKAAGLAFRDMYLDSAGMPVVEKSLFGHLAAGIPGSVAGMFAAHQKYGKLNWKVLLAPAISLANKGFSISERQAHELNHMHDRFVKFNPMGTALVKNDKWMAGDKLVQKELGHTLEQIRDKGHAGFYEGVVANHLVEEMKRGGGIMTREDLKNYKAVWRKPITGHYRGYKVITMPPTSSGGIALMQLLKAVEPYPLKRWGFNADSTVQVMVEAERRVYADRATYLGDPDFVKIPDTSLMEESYIKARMSNFNWANATPSIEVKAGMIVPAEHEETTHFSIVDREGNSVSITTTLNGSYGSAVVVKGAGFLLNNEMDDFSVKPGAPNMYGLIGGEANAIAPGKRMLSSMTPAIVEKDGDLFMVVGTPGGSTIITSVFQTILNVVDFKQNMQEAVTAKKVHHQWLPDEVQIEEGAIDSLTKIKLQVKGYKIVPRGSIGRVDAILKTKSGYQSGADPRGDDYAAGW